MKAFGKLQVDEEAKVPQPQENSRIYRDIMGAREDPENGADDWEPMPLDNYEKDEREQAQHSEQEQIRPKRQARVKCEEFINSYADNQ